MVSPNSKKTIFISDAIQYGKEASLCELISLFEINPNIYILDQINCVTKELEKWRLTIAPDITIGDIDTKRIVKSKNFGIIPHETIDTEIHAYENSQLEFKGSLLFDIDKFISNPNFHIREYRSEKVLYSTLKTIAAFLNCGGGVLYIGVNDDGTIFGLHHDCRILNCDGFNPDIWQQTIRNHVSSKFLQGISINDYIDMDFHSRGELSFARLNIFKRERLVFVIKGGTSILYRRQGNRTIEVKIENVEEFISFRKRMGWC